MTLAAHGEGPLRTAAAELGIAFVPLRHVRRPLSVVHDPLGVRGADAALRRVRPDIVHLNSSKAGVLGRIAASVARVPIRVFTAHGWAFKATSGVAARALRVGRPRGAPAHDDDRLRLADRARGRPRRPGVRAGAHDGDPERGRRVGVVRPGRRGAAEPGARSSASGGSRPRRTSRRCSRRWHSYRAGAPG